MAEGCPWFKRYSCAAYAADAVVRMLAGPFGFASQDIQRLYHSRSGFAIHVTRSTQQSPTEDSKFIGAVLSKIYHRGVPAPCSLLVERHVLDKGQEAEVLSFSERKQTGEFQFLCRPRIARLEQMLKACLIPELVVDDRDVDGLLQLYRHLCTEPEQRLFDDLTDLLSDKRLALLVVPQRGINSMLSPELSPSLGQAERVDFAIQIPYLSRGGWLKLVIEVDDETHIGAQQQHDQERDSALQTEGWAVQRLRVRERDGWEPRLRQIAMHIHEAISDELVRAAEELRCLPQPQRKAIERLILLPVAESQLGAALAQVLYAEGTASVSMGDPQGLGLGIAVSAVAETLESICRLYNVAGLGSVSMADNMGEEPKVVFYGIPSAGAWDAIRSDRGTVIAPRVISPEYVEPLLPARQRAVDVRPPERTLTVTNSIHHQLQNVFRKVDFLDGQIEIICRALSLMPVIGLLPTAGGKSLCYQIVSFTQPGFTLVVDPLRSLMIDQQENLNAMGIHRTLAIMSGMELTENDDRRFREIGYRSIEMGLRTFLFVAPERLQMPDFRDHVRSFASNVPIPYCVVDEAHCVSEWGHDFRPAYLNVGRIVRTHCKHSGTQPSLIALTGTASKNVLVDIMRELEISDQDSLVEPRSFDRHELQFEVCRVSARDRMAELAGKLRAILTEYGWLPGQPGEIPSGLVFTYFANDRDIGVTQVAKELRHRLRVPMEIYCGKLPYWFHGNPLEWEREKLEKQRCFKRDELRILVCTHGFGMGIDKPNIRFTVHAMLPRSLEEFYQQCGRAGRDRSSSRCVIIFSDDQPELADMLLDTERTELEDIETQAEQIPRANRGDAIRNTWFLTNNFLGRDIEKTLLDHVVSTILAPGLRTYVGDTIGIDIPFAALPGRLLRERVDEDAKVKALEKALHRLLSVGAIADYMKDYTRRIFTIDLAGVGADTIYHKFEEYLRRYATEGEVRLFVPRERKQSYRDAALDCSSALIDYIYATIEKRRRRAIGEMLLTARKAAVEGSQKFRADLLSYLEESEFTKPISELVTREDPVEWFQVLSRVEGIDGITKLLGACRRQLEESPSHPGLLLLAGLCRIASPYPYQGYSDLRASFISLVRRDGRTQDRIKVACDVVAQTERLVPSRRDLVLQAMLEGDSSLEMARFCYRQAGPDSEVQHLAILMLAHGVFETIRAKEVVP